MIRFKIEITFSKVMALLILVIGVLCLFVLHDKTVLEIAIPTAGALCGIKTLSTSFNLKNRGSDDIQPVEKDDSEIG